MQHNHEVSHDLLEEISFLRQEVEELKGRLDASQDVEAPGEIEDLDLTEIMDLTAVQALIEDFHRLTGMSLAILNLEGRILAITGWQDICRLYHRVHPETEQYCLESDTVLSQGVPPGTFKIYKCKNNIWDMVTPIVVGGRQMGNLFLGQFLFEDETLEIDVFRRQAQMYGFDEGEYLAALQRVPHYTRETIETAMAFCSKFAGMISALSYSNLKLARTLTERDSLLASLREKEAHLRNVLETSLDGFWINDPQGHFKVVNEAYCTMSGYSREELYRMRISDVEAVESPEDVAKHIALLTAAGDARRFETRHRRKGGQEYDVEVSIRYLPTGEGVAFLRDITGRKQMEQQIHRAQRLETAGRIAGQVAHDFNNLLGPIAAYPELMKLQLPPGSELEQYCDQMLASAQQMAEINEDMMALARRGIDHEQVIDLNRLVLDTLSRLPSRPEPLVIQTHLTPEVFAIGGSYSQLVRVLFNLIANAREAMQEAGTLTLSTENVYLEQPLSRYSRVERGEYVRLSISDTGSGIPEAIQDRIFDAFFSTKKESGRKGCGLGLSVVHSIVEDHKGYLDLETEMDRGTTFHLYFPVRRDLPAVLRLEPVKAGKGRILVVDDDEAQRAVSLALLSTLGYQAEAVSSGEEAVERVRREPVDVILLDMVMPGIDGAATYERIAAVRPGQKAIIVSGFSQTERVSQALAMGASGYLRKPLSLNALATALSELLAQTA